MVSEAIKSLNSLDPRITEEQIFEIFHEFDEWLANAHGVSMRGVDGAPDWLTYERMIWDVGERIRLILQKNKALRNSTRLFNKCLEVVADKKYGKGRQTFALLFGDYKKIDYAANLAPLLTDTEIGGHILKTLVKLKVPGHRDAVKPLLKDRADWVRKLAKKYLNENSLN